MKTKYLLLIIIFFISGCAGNFQARKTKDGIIFTGNKKGFEMTYKEDKEGNVEASVDSKSEPFLKLELPERFNLP